MTQPEPEPSHLRGENADDPPAEPSVTDPDEAAESAAASGGG